MRFSYYEPTSADEAVQILGGPHGTFKALAGGTDVLINLRRRAVAYERAGERQAHSRNDRLERGPRPRLAHRALSTIWRVGSLPGSGETLPCLA